MSVNESERMYDLLVAGEQADGMAFGVDQGNPDEPLVRKMVTLGLLENAAEMFGGRVVKVTAVGLRSLQQARDAGQRSIQWSQQPRSVQLNQTVYGSANNQIGDGGTMNVYVQSTPADQLLAQLAMLRELTRLLPEDDRSEALQAIASAEAAAKKGLFERVQSYAAPLVALGTGTLEFVEKVKDVFGL